MVPSLLYTILYSIAISANVALFNSNSDDIPAICRQLVIVSVPSDTSTVAECSLVEKKSGGWQRTWGPVLVDIGRTGIANNKKEGDGKSPAGLFSLNSAFGYRDKPKWMRLNYIKTTSTYYCIDDCESPDYNKIVNKAGNPTWKSAEDMRRKKDKLYDWGLVVGYNTEKPEPCNGSCIFMHIWRAYCKPTAGCTAMSEKDMLALLHKLKTSAHPMLLQHKTEDLHKFYPRLEKLLK